MIGFRAIYNLISENRKNKLWTDFTLRECIMSEDKKTTAQRKEFGVKRHKFGVKCNIGVFSGTLEGTMTRFPKQ